jgi:hypothetical protein
MSLCHQRKITSQQAHEFFALRAVARLFLRNDGTNRNSAGMGPGSKWREKTPAALPYHGLTQQIS